MSRCKFSRIVRAEKIYRLWNTQKKNKQITHNWKILYAVKKYVIIILIYN